MASCRSIALLVMFVLASGGAAAQELSFKADPFEARDGEALVIRGRFTPAGQVKRARIRVRVQGEKDFTPVDMEPADEKTDLWQGTVDAALVRAPAIELFIVAQPQKGRPTLVLGSSKDPVSVPVAQAAGAPGSTENPLETEEERELRTGERARGGTLQGGGAKALRRSRPQPADLRVDDVKEGEPPRLQEEFQVFAAEDATAIAATYAQRTRTAPAIITVITRARIEQMAARSLIDVLKTVPGFETSKSILGFDEVSIRGIRSDPEILLLVDGHRVANIYDGRIPWAIPAELIERVEVIRGPGSAIYGTGAFLGVINVVTREHEYARVRTAMTLLKPSSVMLSGRAKALPTVGDPTPYDPVVGTFAFQNPKNDPGVFGLVAPEVSGAAGVNKAGVKAYASAYARVSRGQRSAVAKDGASDTGIERPPQSMQTDAREARAAFSGKIDYTPPFLFGGHGFARTFLQFEDRGPYFGVFDTLGPRSQLAWIVGTADIGYAQPFLDGGELLVRIYADGHFVDRRLQLSPDDFITVDRNGDGQPERWPKGVLSRTLYTSNTGGTEARLLLPQFFRHRLAVGTQLEGNFIPFFRYSFNRTQSLEALPTLEVPPESAIPQRQNRAFRLGAALYAQDEWTVTDWLFATLGLRLNSPYFDYPFPETPSTDPLADFPWDPRTHITPRAALVFAPLDDLAFKFLYGAAFRSPTFEEKYDQTAPTYADFSAGIIKGNERLGNEYIHTAEAGADYGFKLLGFRYRLAGNAFYSFIGNSIDRIDETGGQDAIGNHGFRHIVGAEGEARVDFAQNTYVYMNVSWHRGWFVEPDNTQRLSWLKPKTYVDAITGFPNSPQDTEVSYLTIVPQYRANIGGNIELFELLDFHADLMLGSERRNNVRSTLERLRAWRVPAYALLNTGFRTRPILGWFGFEADVYNALDFDYRDDVPRPDRIDELLPREGLTLMFGVYLQH